MSIAEQAQSPAAWYADHNDPNQLRWWNGYMWTDDVRPALGVVPSTPVPPSPDALTAAPASPASPAAPAATTSPAAPQTAGETAYSSAPAPTGFSGASAFPGAVVPTGVGGHDAPSVPSVLGAPNAPSAPAAHPRPASQQLWATALGQNPVADLDSARPSMAQAHLTGSGVMGSGVTTVPPLPATFSSWSPDTSPNPTASTTPNPAASSAPYGTPYADGNLGHADGPVPFARSLARATPLTGSTAAPVAGADAVASRPAPSPLPGPAAGPGPRPVGAEFDPFNVPEEVLRSWAPPVVGSDQEFVSEDLASIDFSKWSAETVTDVPSDVAQIDSVVAWTPPPSTSSVGIESGSDVRPSATHSASPGFRASEQDSVIGDYAHTGLAALDFAADDRAANDFAVADETPSVWPFSAGASGSGSHDYGLAGSRAVTGSAQPGRQRDADQFGAAQRDAQFGGTQRDAQFGAAQPTGTDAGAPLTRRQLRDLVGPLVVADLNYELPSD